MKIRNGFVSNSSSSSFIVKTNSNYFEELQKQPDFHYKQGRDLSRCTGVYTGNDLEEFAEALLEDGFCINLVEKILLYGHKYGFNNIALVMDSDEGVGGRLFSPNNDDVLYETEYH